VPIYHIHASGHAPIHRLADFVNEVKPKKLYVVHSAVSEIIRPLIKQKVEVIIQE
jgi:mRNA degradation ribonuclease J1/J2